MAKLIFEHDDAIAVHRPVEAVFDAVAELDALLARFARRPKIEIERLSGKGPAAPGDRWRITGATRLGRRKGVVEVSRLERPRLIFLAGAGAGYRSETEIRFRAVGETCRIELHVRILANGLKARLAAPVIRLFRPRIERRIADGLKWLRDHVESGLA